jgi:hypothetical protein
MTFRDATGFRQTFLKITGAMLAMLLTLFGPARSEAKKRSNPSPAAAADGTAAQAQDEACQSAHRSAQEREHAGRLVDAKELYLACAKAECGTVLHQECSGRYTQLSADIPTVIPLVTDASGAPRVDVEVKMDGELLTARIDGRALAVDPGLHEFSFGTDAGVFSNQRILIAQGQRNRTVSASLGTLLRLTGKPPHAKGKPAVKSEMIAAAATDASEPGATRRAAGTQKSDDDDGDADADADAAPAAAPIAKPIPPMTYALSGAGLVGLGGYALLTYWGRKDNDALSTGCAPHCSQSSVDHVRKLYLAGNISLGMGLASLVAAYWVYAHSRSTSEETPVQAAYLFNIAPTPSGATAAFQGSF